MRARRTLSAVFAVGSLLAMAACSSNDVSSGSDSSSGAASTGTSSSSSTSTSGGGTVRLSGQNFPEAELVADMYTDLLEKGGYKVDAKLVDSRDVYLPIFPSQVDIVPEYVGGIVNALNTKANGANATPFTQGDGAALASAGQSLLDSAGITLLNQSEATDANAFMVTKDYASQNNATKLSDLSGKSVVLAAAPDCEGRLDCAGGLEKQYGIDVTKVLPLGYASDQTYKSVLDGESQLGETSTTDGTLDSQGLVVLQDDKMIQPAQNLVPAVSSAFLKAHPDVADILNPLMATLTTADLTDLNGEISVDRKKPADVAKEYLDQKGLL